MDNIKEESKKVYSLLSVFLWEHLINHIKDAIESNQNDIATIIENSIKNEFESNGFSKDETDHIYKIFEDNIVGFDIANEIDLPLAYKLTGYILNIKNNNYMKKELIQILHQFEIDSISNEGINILQNYETYNKN